MPHRGDGCPFLLFFFPLGVLVHAHFAADVPPLSMRLVMQFKLRCAKGRDAEACANCAVKCLHWAFSRNVTVISPPPPSLQKQTSKEMTCPRMSDHSDLPRGLYPQFIHYFLFPFFPWQRVKHYASLQTPKFPLVLCKTRLQDQRRMHYKDNWPFPEARFIYFKIKMRRLFYMFAILSFLLGKRM